MKFIPGKLSFLLGLTLLSAPVFAETTQINTLTTETTTSTPAMGEPSAKEDMAITKSVKALIKNSSTLAKLPVDVKTTKGDVMLSGKVESDSQASSLVELAQSVVGVKDVDTSNLTIKDSTQPFTDAFITAKVKGLFFREKVFGDKDIAALNISVETQNGVVYLTGAIDNQEQVNTAIKLAESVKGVTKVEYNVKKVTPMSATSPN